MKSEFDENASLMRDKFVYIEGYLDDYVEDFSLIMDEAERILVIIEENNASKQNYKRFCFLLNKIKGNSTIVGDKFVANITAMLEDIALKLPELTQTDIFSQIVELMFYAFDELKNHMKTLRKEQFYPIINEDIINKIQNMHSSIGAARDIISQEDVDSLFE
ncbi:MAG: hypothetical protein L3V56_03395 [Candidatus Magnetoovum sp. WYHC-5]|nr:hypothetical protein [Candidatus Magnetoovum sp. WYHC-5]